MSRWPKEDRPEREAFWRAHHEGSRRSELNRREYCEAYGLPQKRFGNRRAKLKHRDGQADASQHTARHQPSRSTSRIDATRCSTLGPSEDTALGRAPPCVDFRRASRSDADGNGVHSKPGLHYHHLIRIPR